MTTVIGLSVEEVDEGALEGDSEAVVVLAVEEG